MTPRVFIVEDNALIREAVTEYLQIEGYEVVQFEAMSGVIDALTRTPPDVIILDIMLPDGNGFHLARRIREKSHVPIVFLTAKDAESDRITGFELGGDDYVVKPFSAKELVLRVKALLRRLGPEADEEHESTMRRQLSGSILEIDPATHRVHVDKRELTLTDFEWRILAFLARNPERVVSRNAILGECLEYMHDGSARTVDTHVANLRGKLGDHNWIETVRGYGYRFVGISP
ncbi:MAG: DNA-binding response regulator [Spirochaetaceae bacterium]|nr:MAG: DNA-binding response regulator [Spirochaetaceae bacterium]